MLWLVIALLVAGCAGRPMGNLIVTSQQSAPDTDVVDMLVATTRAPVTEPAGVMFGGERAIGLAFADIAVSIPPDCGAQDRRGAMAGCAARRSRA